MMDMSKRAVMALALSCCAALPVPAQTPAVGGPSIQAFGFGDANFVATARPGKKNFVLGQVVGHVNAAMTDRLALFGEASLSGRDEGYALEIERIILRYDFGDLLKLSVGRYHSPISYWNTAFHHGLWLQTSVARPRMIRFGTRFMPVHFVGALAEGALPSGPLGLAYTVGVGNGRQSDNLARAGDIGDSNSSSARTWGLMLRPPALLGLQIGGGVYTDDIRQSGGPTKERIFSGHAVLARESPEIVAEFARVRHEADSTGTSNNDSYYVQVGYRLPGRAHAFKPYVRWERLDIASNDPVLVGSDDAAYAGVIAGVRFDFADYGALKAEYRNDRIGPNARLNSLWLQASFAVTGGTSEHSMHTVVPAVRGSKQ
jgi:hypothetical protein